VGWAQDHPAGVYLHKEIEIYGMLQGPLWEKVEHKAHGGGNRLGLKMVVETRLLRPARISPNFDQAGTQGYAKGKPAK